ncbi:hypothetical protein GGR57DRAFT_485873 [Xylariaceae sp. FL1272]|nr:hypothetical protein GGR57DRAFT_485873 [Xylariaceae sp. FL1272]
MAGSLALPDGSEEAQREAHTHGPFNSSRLLRRHRSPPVKLNTCSDSLKSLDRIFETRSREAQELSSPTIARGLSLTPLEKKFIESTYGVEEMRDGFFDAIFLPPEESDAQALMSHAEETLPIAFRKKDPLSLSSFFPRQCHEAASVVRRVTTTRSGIKLLKSFLAYFIAYILCLVPIVRSTFGRYAYIMAVSTLINHPGRTLGAQVDGTILTIVGTVTGLGWGAFGLWVSTATASARVGFGGILAAFLFLYIFVIACLRSYYIRTYQGVICAGIAISYTCLAEVSGVEVSWSKLLAYGLPWLAGQAISLVICAAISPTAGSRPLAAGLHQILTVMMEGLEPIKPEPLRTRRRLTQSFVGMSQIYRDLVVDFSITTLDPKDVLALRNLIQSVIRSLLSLRTDTRLFDHLAVDRSAEEAEIPEFVVNMDRQGHQSTSEDETQILKFVIESLGNPTERLLKSMRQALQSCDATLMDICGHRRSLGPPPDVSNDVHTALARLRRHIIIFNNCQDHVLASDRLPHTYSKFPEVVKVFAFCLPVQQAATSIETLVAKVDELQQKQSRVPKFYFPSYPFFKALHRTNAQVRHDRGGVTAGSYFRSFSDIARLIQKLKSQEFNPADMKDVNEENLESSLATMTADDISDDSGSEKNRLRHKIWTGLKRAQGFETRFGLKTALVTSVLAIPAYLTTNDSWWDDYEFWWAVVMGWLIMGPRTGGNVQDLFARAFCAVVGSVWGGLAYLAGNGNPYVIGVFAAIYMLPMMYRYTQSSHPRSGMVGCISFTVVSLSEVIAQGKPSPAAIAATKGAAMLLGVVASIIVNWILWPFVARHDLRKGMASMIFYCSILYRNIVAKYVYYEEGHAPTQADIEASEILEGRLREGFVRLRQLMGLTRHEIRLRAPFDPLPYSGLVDACERFFEYIVTVRQSSLRHHPAFIRDNSEAAMSLLGHRRDAIATILTNLYVLSAALRANREVPKYLPSAHVTRMRLLDKMAELESEIDINEKYSKEQRQEEIKLAQIYSFSYNESLTGCMEQLGQLEKYTKAIVGEQGFECGIRD